MTEKLRLSKSKFIAGIQCSKRLYLTCHTPDLSDDDSISRQFRLDEGSKVGELARDSFPGGILITEDRDHSEEAIQSTKKAMDNKDVDYFFEAAFKFNDVLVRVDVLYREEDGSWDIIEVKSSTKVKPEHILDLAIQKYVLEGCGLKISKTGVLFVDNTYVYDGKELDLDQYFVISDVTEQTSAMEDKVKTQVKQMQSVLAQKAVPEIKVGRQCNKPYKCDFFNHCHSTLPSYHIITLPRITQQMIEKMYSDKIDTVALVPEDYAGLTSSQKRVKQAVLQKGEIFDLRELNTIRKLQFPIHFIDFETINPAVPIFSNTRPYERIPFQWSMHTLNDDGSIEHKEFLSEGTEDPRQKFVETLIFALQRQGSILVYSSAEKSVLNQLKKSHKKLEKYLDGITTRFVDLMAIMQKGFYHPGFNGSYSLKNIVPVLVDDLKYDDLAIREGMAAAALFQRTLEDELSDKEVDDIRASLFEYCKADTHALLKIYQFLNQFLDQKKSA